MPSFPAPSVDLAALKDLLALVGGIFVVLAPLLAAYARSFIHSAIATAPAMTALATRVEAVEHRVDEHAESVALVPQLAAILERLERAVTELNTTLRERVARLEGEVSR